MWTLPALGFARRRKAKQSKNETPLILVYAGGAVKTLGLHRPAFLFGKSMRSIVALSLHAFGSSNVRRNPGLNARQSLHGRKGGNAVAILHYMKNGKA